MTTVLTHRLVRLILVSEVTEELHSPHSVIDFWRLDPLLSSANRRIEEASIKSRSHYGQDRILPGSIDVVKSLYAMTTTELRQAHYRVEECKSQWDAQLTDATTDRVGSDIVVAIQTATRSVGDLLTCFDKELGPIWKG